MRAVIPSAISGSRCHNATRLHPQLRRVRFLVMAAHRHKTLLCAADSSIQMPFGTLKLTLSNRATPQRLQRGHRILTICLLCGSKKANFRPIRIGEMDPRDWDVNGGGSVNRAPLPVPHVELNVPCINLLSEHQVEADIPTLFNYEHTRSRY